MKLSPRRRLPGHFRIRSKVLLAFALTLSAAPLLTSPSQAQAQAPAADKKELRIGFMPGPYRDAFRTGIQPQLERKGYAVKYVEFSIGVQVNDALDKGNIDANIFQHTIYLESINKKEKFDNVPIVHVPTPPMGLYSQRLEALADVKDGATVTLPADPVNAARALAILDRIGWVKLAPNLDPISVSERDITANPKHLKLVPLDAAQAPRSLADADFAAIQGNFAVASGLKLTEALALEQMTLPYVNVVAVRRANQDAKWAQDIVTAYKSAEFQQTIRATRAYDGYRLPDYFSK